MRTLYVFPEDKAVHFQGNFIIRQLQDIGIYFSCNELSTENNKIIKFEYRNSNIPLKGLSKKMDDSGIMKNHISNLNLIRTIKINYIYEEGKKDGFEIYEEFILGRSYLARIKKVDKIPSEVYKEKSYIPIAPSIVNLDFSDNPDEMQYFM